MIDLEAARHALATARGEGVRIAIIDSGVQVDHPELAGLRLADDVAIVATGMGLTRESGEGRDVFGHGTAIAGIIRQLAPAAEIGSIRVLGENLTSRTEIISEGVRTAIDLKYDILNCSFGCGMSTHVLSYKSWVDLAYLSDIHIVAACNNFDVRKVEWPAYFSSAITVNMAATADPLAFFYRPRRLVEFAARGNEVDVLWNEGGRKTVTGSSYAAPHVSALLARILCAGKLNTLEAKDALRLLARPWSDEVAGVNEVGDE